MKWLAVRIALGVLVWLLYDCSGAQQQQQQQQRQQRQRQQELNGNSSTCLVSEVPSEITRKRASRDYEIVEDASIFSTTDEEEEQDSFFRHVTASLRGGGGSEEQKDDFDDKTTLTNASKTHNATGTQPQQQQQQQNDNESTNKTLLSSLLHKQVKRGLQTWKNKGQRRTEFLDRMALVSDAMLEQEHDALLEKEPENATGVTHQSDFTRPGRYFTIVTTAALPWMTGTAVNPLLRAAHLVRKTQQINNSTNNSTNATRGQQQWVTLVVPWLELPQDQQALYDGRVFPTQQHQEEYIRTWLAENAEMPDAASASTGLIIRFYPARHHPGLGSIFAMGDICELIPQHQADVCILEEPEHLNWYRAPGTGWTLKFQYVVGIVHTNYKEYASAHYSGLWTAPAIAVMSSAMVRAYCHSVIKLSHVLQTFAPEKEKTANVHGVRAEFLKEGMRRAQQEASLLANKENVMQQEPQETTVYFIGKLLWAKGLDLLLDLQEYYKQCTGEYFSIDIYGSGPEQTAIMRSFHGRKKLNGDASNDNDDCNDDDESEEEEEETSILLLNDNSDKLMVNGDDSPETNVFTVQFKTRQRLQKIKETIKATTESLEFDLPKSLHEYRRQPIPATFPGRVDHALLTKQYKVFVNPSVSEVLCTTTAEALAMGKFAIIPVHPSNEFFLRFPNCLAYRNKFEFVANLRWALTHEPEPLTPQLAREFTWEAATERLIEASAITHAEALERERLGLSKRDERIAWFHNELGKGVTGDAIRKVLGGGPVSKQVKYQRAQQSVELDDDIIEEESDQVDDEEEEDDDSEDDDDGLPLSLRMSSFGAAIRSTVANGLPSLKAGGS